MKTKTAIIYSDDNNRLAQAVAKGAYEADGDVRLRHVPEPSIESAPRGIPEASPEDLEWADTILIGTSARSGLPSAHLLAFLEDCAHQSWTVKVVSTFACSTKTEGERDCALQVLTMMLCRRDCIFIPPSFSSNAEVRADIERARQQGRRTVSIARQLISGRLRS